MICLGCGKQIRGEPRIMKLKITDTDTRLIARARELGFESSTWREGDFILGHFDKNCFAIARRVWQVAFSTRRVRPR